LSTFRLVTIIVLHQTKAFVTKTPISASKQNTISADFSLFCMEHDQTICEQTVGLWEC